ncbi:phage integrase N-terminal domain-containing protein [Polaromonas sp. JS666]|uniref:phage integrase N-terminal domain-containing protein n=1 Tax=Polaromonas sp. (strain JS666 / ATCC BAA-500) TaxID=296591 RepID=UPI0000535851|nr:phage integrase N-terminal domain-containing protein [Polaromonas sp. JS666]ABE47287.1 hypothetical protein Bpro_5433 [Polaromonas sp. JS666]
MSNQTTTLTASLALRESRTPAPVQYNRSQAAPLPHAHAPMAPLGHAISDQIRDLPIREQISAILTDRARFLGEYPSRRVLSERIERLVTAYTELRAMGFQITDVTSFGLKHARALLENWKQRELSRKTIYNRWSTLRSWTLALNKHGMLGSIDEFWPDFSANVRDRTGGRQLTAQKLQERSDYLRAQRDKTHYFVDRLAREAGMVREDALQIELNAAHGIVQGYELLRCGHGGGAKVYKDMARHQVLFAEMVDFMQQRNRTSLCWTGLDIEDAVTKYKDRLVYVGRVLFPKNAEKTGQQGGEE